MTRGNSLIPDHVHQTQKQHRSREPLPDGKDKWAVYLHLENLDCTGDADSNAGGCRRLGALLIYLDERLLSTRLR